MTDSFFVYLFANLLRQANAVCTQLANMNSSYQQWLATNKKHFSSTKTSLYLKFIYSRPIEHFDGRIVFLRHYTQEYLKLGPGFWPTMYKS